MMLNKFALELLTTEFRNKFKTSWDFVEQLSDEEYLQLRKNPYFITLLESISLASMTDEEIIKLMTQPILLDESKDEKDSIDNTVSKLIEGIETDDPMIELDTSDDKRIVGLEENNALEAYDEYIDNNERAQPVREEMPVYKTYDDMMRARSRTQALKRIEKIVEEPIEIHDGREKKIVDSPVKYQSINKIGDFQLTASMQEILANVRLNLAALNKNQHYAIERIQQHVPEFDLKELLTYSTHDLLSYPNIGAKVVNSLLALLEVVREELIDIDAGNLDYQGYEATYIIPSELQAVTLEELRVLMSEDIATFVSQLDGQEATIFNGRTGYAGQDVQTLQVVGDVLAITRERVRQIESDIYQKLKRSLRLNEFQLIEIIKKNLSYQLPAKMDKLSFKTEKLFFSFLEKMSGLTNLNKIANPEEMGELKLDILDDFFALNGTEVSYHELFSYLYMHDDIESYSDMFGEIASKERVIESYIEKLIRADRLLFTSEFRIRPQSLPKDCAAAALLCGYPEGLHWREIGRQVNELALSRTRLEEERVDNGAVGGTKYTYLLDKGVYGNTKFLNLDRINFDNCFDELLAIFESSNTETMHLSTIFGQFDKKIVSDYYTLRYIIRTFGEDYGFYFKGKSQVDNVSLNKDAKTIGQEDLIVSEMNMCERSMNKEEVAQLLKSKSVNHASFYLDKLMDEGRVVRVDHMLYTTPEVAYKNIDLDQILGAMQELIGNTDKPIDYSYFGYLFNAELDLDYSMYFYGSIARKYAEENGWFRKQFLFSNQEIPFNSVADVVVQVCREEGDIYQRLRDLKNHIYIDDERGKSAIYQNMNMRGN